MPNKRPPVPEHLLLRWSKMAERLGYGKRGGRAKLLDFWMDYTDAHPDLFRKR